MKITFAPRGILQIDEARIIYRNFAGVSGKFNAEGKRNFCLIIPTEELARELIDKGWNVKTKAPRDEGEEPLRYLKVNVKFGEHGPTIYLRSGKSNTVLDENTVSCLDNIDISSVDMDIRPYNYEVNGEMGISAYLKTMCVYQEVDRFAERFAEESSNEVPEDNEPF